MNMLDNLGKINELKKQFEKMQEQLHTVTAEGAVGGGMVSVKINGNLTLLSVQIEEQLLDPEKKNVVEEMLCSAVNLAMHNIKETIKTEYGRGMPNFPDVLGT